MIEREIVRDDSGVVGTGAVSIVADWHRFDPSYASENCVCGLPEDAYVHSRQAQSRAALQSANAARVNGSMVRREIKCGELHVADALYDDRAASLEVWALLAAQRRWSRDRANMLLREHWIGELRRVKDLTGRQRSVLASELRQQRDAA